MTILVDANLPPFLAAPLAPVATLDGQRVDYIPHLYGPGIKDVDGIARATQDGGATFLTRDNHMRTRPAEVQALIASACIGIILTNQWQQDEEHDLAARILRRWPHILTCMKATPPALFEFTWAWESRPPRQWRGLERMQRRSPAT